DQLGFQIAFDARIGSRQRLLAVAPPDGTAVLALVQPEPGSAHAQLIGRATQVVFVTDDVPATYSEWRRRGVRFHGTPRLRRAAYEQAGPSPDRLFPAAVEPPTAWGGVFTRFEDIDHNSFALVSFDEVSRVAEAQRRAAAERLEAERRAAHELEIAPPVQARLFPQRLPRFRALGEAGARLPAARVGAESVR